MKKIFFYVVLASSFLSCNKKNKDLKKNALVVRYDKSIENDNLFDLIYDLDFFKIKKENKDINLPNIRNLIKKDKNYFLSSDIANGSFFITNSHGELKSSFNHKGEGPKEYNEITCFDVDKRSIFIYDFQKQVIKIYDFSGEFIGENKIAYYFKDFIKTNYGYVLFTAKHTNKVDEDVLNFDLLFIDETGLILNKELPYNPELFKTVRLHKASPFYKNEKGDLFFNDLMSDSVIRVESKGINRKAYYTFQYVDKTLTEEQKNKPHDVLFKDLIKIANYSEGISYLANLKAITKNIILYSYKRGSSSVFVIKNKKDNSLSLYSFNLQDTDNKSIFSPYFIEDENLVTLIYPYTLRFLKDQYIKYDVQDEKLLDKLNQLINSTEEDGSQLIMKYKIKG